MKAPAEISSEELFIQAVVAHPRAFSPICALVRLKLKDDTWLFKVAARYGFNASVADGIMDGWDIAAGLGTGTFKDADAALRDPFSYARGLKLGELSYNACLNAGKIA